MAARIRMRDASGTLRTITRMRMRDAGGTLRTIQRVRMRDAGNVLRTVWQGFTTVVASPSGVFGEAGGPGVEGYVTSPAITATPIDGSPPYTYGWGQVSGGAITIDDPTSSSTTFSGTDNIFTELGGTFVCGVTDNNGVVVYSNEVGVLLTWTNI